MQLLKSGFDDRSGLVVMSVAILIVFAGPSIAWSQDDEQADEQAEQNTADAPRAISAEREATIEKWIDSPQVPILNQLPYPERFRDVAKVGCGHKYNATASDPGQELLDCHGDLKDQARSSDADVVLLTVDSQMCTGNVCWFHMYGMAYKYVGSE